MNLAPADAPPEAHALLCTQDPLASPTERNTQKHRASAARGGSGVQPFLSGSGNAQRMTNCRGSVFMPSIKNQETCTECCISSLGGQCSGTALPGHSPAPWASDHPGDSPGASLVSELGLCGWLGSTPAWFADSEKRHREGHLVPQGRSVADCSRAPWQRPPEKGREWSKRRTGRLRARRAPPSLIPGCTRCCIQTFSCSVRIAHPPAAPLSSG